MPAAGAATLGEEACRVSNALSISPHPVKDLLPAREHGEILWERSARTSSTRDLQTGFGGDDVAARDVLEAAKANDAAEVGKLHDRGATVEGMGDRPEGRGCIPAALETLRMTSSRS